MKRQVYTLISLLLIIGGLTAVYFVHGTGGETAGEQHSAQSENIPLISRSKADILEVSVTNPTASYTLVPTGDDVWVMCGFEDVPLSAFVVNPMTNMLFYFPAYEMLTESPKSLAEYGLDAQTGTPAIVTAAYTGGETERLIIGNRTPDGSFYYAAREGDSAVYLILASYGARFYNGYDEIVDKNLHYLNIAALYQMTVKKDSDIKLDIHFAAPTGETDKEAFEAHMAAYGETFVDMRQPFPGRAVYLSAVTTHLEGGFDGYRLGTLVEFDCKDFSAYGLDIPALSVFFEDMTGELLIEVGAFADEEQKTRYARINGGISVFIMEDRFFAPFWDMNPLKFIERFIIAPLPNIGTVTRIEITSAEHALMTSHAQRPPGGYYDILINHADDPPDVTGAGDIAPTINGQAVDDEAFRLFYRTVIGLLIEGYDTDFKISETDEPAVTIKFHLHTDRGVLINHYYDYDNIFFAATLPESENTLLTSRQLMRIMFESLEGLL